MFGGWQPGGSQGQASSAGQRVAGSDTAVAGSQLWRGSEPDIGMKAVPWVGVCAFASAVVKK